MFFLMALPLGQAREKRVIALSFMMKKMFFLMATCMELKNN